jgi:hypothetical protein
MNVLAARSRGWTVNPRFEIPRVPRETLDNHDDPARLRLDLARLLGLAATRIPS